MDSAFKIRQATLADFKFISSIANHEDWNVSENDAEPLLALDPLGSFIAELNNETIGCITAIKYGTHCHIGFYIIKEGHRGKGYGTQLFEQAMSHAKDAKTVGLDAVEEHQHVYEKSGFKAYERFMGYQRKAEGVLHAELVDLKQVPGDQLAEYDQSVGKNPRRTYLEALLKQENYYGLGLIKENILRGYGIIRKSHVGYEIGPMIADDAETFEKILDGLQSLVSGQEVIINTFERDLITQEVMARQKWPLVRRLVTMYLNGVPPERDRTKAYIPLAEIG